MIGVPIARAPKDNVVSELGAQLSWDPSFCYPTKDSSSWVGEAKQNWLWHIGRPGSEKGN